MFRAPALIFWACDMPLVSEGLILLVLGAIPVNWGGRLLLSRGTMRAGFPFVSPGESDRGVGAQIAAGHFRCIRWRRSSGRKSPSRRLEMAGQLANVNNTEDLAAAVRAWRGGIPLA